jgi:bla regulator protein blaR1
VDYADKTPLYILDGKEITKKEMEQLDPKAIGTIIMWKGVHAVSRYGDKAKNGVVEIELKATKE